MASTLELFHASSSIELGLLVSGMHLSDQYGNTSREIQASALPILAEVGVELHPRSGLTVAMATGLQLSRFAAALDEWNADFVAVLGDRPEMLAGAMASTLLSTPVIHIHGGERSGSVDESIRHAISKIAHLHCVATNESAERLMRMGEAPESIHITGAPGLDGIIELASQSEASLSRQVGFDVSKDYVMAVFHPVTHEQGSLAGQVDALLSALMSLDVDVVLVRPNSDAGGDEIDEKISTCHYGPRLHTVKHLKRQSFLSLLRHASAMVGNSSSGIIEAASFGVPVVDVGSRQNMRERGDNVFWAASDREAIEMATRRALKAERFSNSNIYGDGQAGMRILKIVESLDVGDVTLAKVNAF